MNPWTVLTPRTGIIILFLIFAASCEKTTMQSLFQLDSFSALLPCAQGCFAGWVPGCVGEGDVLGLELGCIGGCGNVAQAAPESCYCRTDYQTIAVSFVSKCVEQQCTLGEPNIDLESAVKLYEGYCTSKGYLAMPTAPASVAATPTGPIESPTTVYVTVTVTAAASRPAATLLVFIPVSAVDTRNPFVLWIRILLNTCVK
jgi:hypothetical protein